MLRTLSGLLLGIAMLTHTNSVHGQQVLAPSKVDILVDFPAKEVHFNPLVDSLRTYAHDTIALSVLVVLPTGAIPSTLHIVAGTTEGANDLLEKDFVYDVSSVLPDGTTYRREGENVYLGLGNYFGISKIYAKVSLGYSGGGVSEAVAVNTN